MPTTNACRLRDDHAKARVLGDALGAQPYVASVAAVSTNIVIFNLPDSVDAAALVAAFKAHGVLVSQMAAKTLRMVTHLDVSGEDVARVVALLPQLAVSA